MRVSKCLVTIFDVFRDFDEPTIGVKTFNFKISQPRLLKRKQDRLKLLKPNLINWTKNSWSKKGLSTGNTC